MPHTDRFFNVRAACRVGMLLALAGASRASATVEAGPAEAHYRPRDIVLLVDASKSMDDAFPEVRAALREFVTGARAGDTVTLVPFSADPVVAAHVRIGGPADRDRLLRAIADLRPSGRYTNITESLQRGVRRLRRAQLDQSTERRVRFVVLLTDGRHNPPGVAVRPVRPASGTPASPSPPVGDAPAGDSWRAAPTFDDILTLYEDFRPGHEWFVQYIALQEEVDEEILAFVRRARGQVLQLTAEGLPKLNLNAALNAFQVPLTVALRDVCGGVVRERQTGGEERAEAGTGLEIGDRIRTSAGSRAIIDIEPIASVGVDPDTTCVVVCGTFAPVTDTYRTNVQLESGRLCTLVRRQGHSTVFDARSPNAVARVAGTAFLMDAGHGAATAIAVFDGAVRVGPARAEPRHSLARNQMVRVLSLGAVGEPEPLAGPARGAWPIWEEVLERRARLSQAALKFAALAWRSLDAEIGPLEAGRTYAQEIEVRLPELLDRDPRVAVVNAQLPPGVDVRAEFAPPPLAVPGLPARVRVRVTTAPDWAPPIGVRYAAAIRLQARGLPSEPPVEFPLRLFTGRPLRTVSTSMSFPARVRTKLREVPLEVWWGLLALSVVGPAAVYLGSLWQQNRRTELPLGRLLLTVNPAPAQWNQTAIDLEALARGAGQSTITIGRAADNVLGLPDPNLLPQHAELRVEGRRRANRRLLLQLRPGATARIDGERLDLGFVELRDKMRIRLGGFEFVYEDTKHYEQVEIAARDGQVIHGILHSWDLTGHGILVAPEHADLADDRAPVITVFFSEIEDITVFKRPGRTWRRGRLRALGPAATVLMRSGRKHAGCVRRDYSPKQLRFYFFPADRPDVDYMVIEWGAIQEIHVEGLDTVRIPRPDQRV